MYNSIPRHRDPFFNEIEDQINMSRPVTTHFFSGSLVDLSKAEEASTPINRRLPDQDFWDERTKTKEFASKF